MSKIGVINEIGDMGLGFDELNDKDQKAYNEQQVQKNDADKKVKQQQK